MNFLWLFRVKSSLYDHSSVIKFEINLDYEHIYILDVQGIFKHTNNIQQISSVFRFRHFSLLCSPYHVQITARVSHFKYAVSPLFVTLLDPAPSNHMIFAILTWLCYIISVGILEWTFKKARLVTYRKRSWSK